MKHPEEALATDLHRELTRRFCSTPTTVSIEGAGVHWRCTARRRNSLCAIACFTTLGPEYYTDFKRDSKDVATARIPSRDETIAAVADWLDGNELVELHAKYPFVDKTKRALCRLRDDVIAVAPELQIDTRVELEHKGADIYYLRFWADKRSCEISFYGKNELPDAVFAWDDCQLFEFKPDDNSRLAAVLKRWVRDESPPSAMRSEFSWLEIGKLADFYENGKPIEGEFIKSWDWMERFYEDTPYPFGALVRKFIGTMRSGGYDKTLRAGQSLWSLILSRSRRHGLRQEQPCIQFWFRNDVMDVFYRQDAPGNQTELRSVEIKLTSEIDALLKRLQATTID